MRWCCRFCRSSDRLGLPILVKQPTAIEAARLVDKVKRKTHPQESEGGSLTSDFADHVWTTRPGPVTDGGFVVSVVAEAYAIEVKVFIGTFRCFEPWGLAPGWEQSDEILKN